ncbi:MAG: AbrB/MazE/SpoVT family DNA-binding domain-containing protein [Ardenticatenales bacterium]|nr:AbrB/MazE/SpoVT family DNA-binding domain-containing protein [Ardenticatenales bacterium]
MFTTRILRWGNSQGLRLSKQILDLADIAVGDDVEVVVGDHQIVVKKRAHPPYVLADLVARIPEGYCPVEADAGPPVGREEW